MVLYPVHFLKAKSKFAFTLGGGTPPLCAMSQNDINPKQAIKQAKKQYAVLLKTKPQFALAIRKKSIAQFTNGVPHLKWENVTFKSLWSMLEVKKPVYPFPGYETLTEQERRKIIFKNQLKEKQDYVRNFRKKSQQKK